MHARPRLILAGGATMLVAALALVVLPPRNAAHAATANVTVADFDFTDSASGTLTTTITAGDSVLWTWSGGDMHSVTADDDSFDDPAGSSKASGTFSHQFNSPGTYAYYCRVHGGPGGTGMHGIVVVNAAALTATATNTPAPTATAPAASRTPTNTPVASTTAMTTATASTATAGPASSTPTREPLLVAAPETTAPTGAVAALPSTGSTESAGTGVRRWLVIVLAVSGVAAVAASALLRRQA